MRARYYSPELRRFVNSDILMGDINNSTTLNRYAYANGNPISNIDPFGLAADSRGGKNNFTEYLKDFIFGFADTTWKMGETLFAVIGGFDFEAGYGSGLRFSADFLGESFTIGSKVDLLSLKFGSDYFDLGQEALSGAEWNLSFVEGIGIGLEKGYFESYLTNTIEQYEADDVEIKFNIVGIDFYLIQGVNASVSYDFVKVFNKIVDIWS